MPSGSDGSTDGRLLFNHISKRRDIFGFMEPEYVTIRKVLSCGIPISVNAF